jgi:hypothetical protein
MLPRLYDIKQDAMAAPGLDPKLYSSLDHHQKEIRVLRLKPIPKQDQPICCEMWTVCLREDRNEFLPLSYVWGDQHTTKEISVNGYPFQATLNLIAFFYHFRFLPKRLQALPLWVDAICINQGAATERSEQVKLMAEIYGRNQTTISWLGPASKNERSNFAIYWINTIAKVIANQFQKTGTVRSTHWLEKYAPDLLPPNMTVWYAISELLQRPYWQRVWTLQEVVLPENNLMLCGSQSFQFFKLSIIPRSLSLSQQEDLTEAHRRSQLTHSPYFRVHFHIFRVDRINQLKRILDPESRCCADDIHQRWSTLFQHSVELDATDPRDHIYGMSSIWPGPSLDIDYTKSVRDIYVEQATMMITHDIVSPKQKAAILTTVLSTSGYRQGTSVVQQKWPLPSWVPSWARARHFKMVIEEFDASALNQTLPIFQPRTIIKGAVLQLTGVKHSTVQLLQKSQSRDILKFAKCVLQDGMKINAHYTNSMTGFQAFLRALISDWAELENQRIRNDFKILLEYASALLLVLWSHENNDGKTIYSPSIQGLQLLLRDLDVLSTRDFEETFGIAHMSHPQKEIQQLSIELPEHFFAFQVTTTLNVARLMWSLLVPHKMPDHKLDWIRLESPRDIVNLSLKAMDHILAERTRLGYGRTMFWTKNGYLGSTWAEVIQGDFICLLFGCDLPVILRQINDHYIHIGTCFIVGLMDGEAFNDIENRDLLGEDFSIH